MSDPVREKYQELSENILEHVKPASQAQITEILNKAASEAVAEADAQAKAMAQFAASMSKFKVQFYLLGMAIGGVTGALVAFRVAYRKAETKYAKITEGEIAEMRQHYQEKGRALEAEAAKRPVSEIVKERGYGSPGVKSAAPPMAVPPPLVASEETTEDSDEEPEVRNIFQEAQVEHEWDWHAERSKRSPDIPYVIHYDERHELEGYTETTLTYYTVDDVLCNERDEVIDPDFERDKLIGDGNLDRFGHGSNDASIVYIRNDQLEIMFEVVKSPNSFSEEVHGFSHDAYDRRNLERMRARERDEEN